MQKILSIFLHGRNIRFLCTASMLAVLSGCELFMAPTYGYMLLIENKLATTITSTGFCHGPGEDVGYPCVIPGKSKGAQTYIVHSDKPTEEDVYGWFDNQKITICGKPISFKSVRLISPLIKHDQYHFEIIIDRAVSDAFCQQDSQND